MCLTTNFIFKGLFPIFIKDTETSSTLNLPQLTMSPQNDKMRGHPLKLVLFIVSIMGLGFSLTFHYFLYLISLFLECFFVHDWFGFVCVGIIVVGRMQNLWETRILQRKLLRIQRNFPFFLIRILRWLNIDLESDTIVFHFQKKSHQSRG